MKERKEKKLTKKKRTSRGTRKQQQQKTRPGRLAVDRRFVSYLPEVNVFGITDHVYFPNEETLA